MKQTNTHTSRVALKLVAAILLVYCLYQLTRTLMGLVYLILMAILAAAVTFLLKIYPRWRKSEADRALRMADVDDMDGVRFEKYVSELLKAQGYKTEMTPARNDYGVDIVAERDGVRYAVQCKRRGENISRDAVSDAVAGKHYYKCGRAMVVTNRYFRSGAKELASASQCELIDRDALVSWIQTFQTAETPASMTSTKARSVAIWTAVGSSACLILLIVADMANSARRASVLLSAEKAVTTPVAAVPKKTSSKRKLSPERNAFLEILIKELISRGATSEQIAEARARVEAMPEAEFQAILKKGRELNEEEKRRIEQGVDESQKPPEQRGQADSSGEHTPRTKYIYRQTVEEVGKQ